MPKDGDPLPKEQVALIRKWIAEGAKYDAPKQTVELVSIIPRKPHPNPPEAYRTAVPVTALAFAPAGKELAVGGYHEITIWNPADGKLLRRIKDVEQRTFGLAYSDDGKTAGRGRRHAGRLGRSGPVRSGKRQARSPARHDERRGAGLAFDPTGKKLAVCGGRSFDSHLRRRDRQRNAAHRRPCRLGHVHRLEAPTARNSSPARAIRRRRSSTPKTGDSVTTYPGHGETVLGVAFAPDGKSVLSGGADKKIHVWNPADGKQIATITGFGGEVYRVADRRRRHLELLGRQDGQASSARRSQADRRVQGPRRLRLQPGREPEDEALGHRRLRRRSSRLERRRSEGPRRVVPRRTGSRRGDEVT